MKTLKKAEAKKVINEVNEEIEFQKGVFKREMSKYISSKIRGENPNTEYLEEINQRIGDYERYVISLKLSIM